MTNTKFTERYGYESFVYYTSLLEQDYTASAQWYMMIAQKYGIDIAAQDEVIVKAIDNHKLPEPTEEEMQIAFEKLEKQKKDLQEILQRKKQEELQFLIGEKFI